MYQDQETDDHFSRAGASLTVKAHAQYRRRVRREMVAAVAFTAQARRERSRHSHRQRGDGGPIVALRSKAAEVTSREAAATSAAVAPTC